MTHSPLGTPSSFLHPNVIKSTNYQVLHYAVFSSLLLLCPSQKPCTYAPKLPQSNIYTFTSLQIPVRHGNYLQLKLHIVTYFEIAANIS